MSKLHEEYTKNLELRLNQLYVLGNNAKKKGIDPSLEPETKVAKDLADLVEGLVGPIGVAKRIRALNSLFTREELAFKIAEEIINGDFGHMLAESSAEKAIRASLAILTEGVTAAPLQGIAKVKIKKNYDNTKYLAIYFAGPIRSAGGTDQALTLIIGDFIRILLGINRYNPIEDEIARFIEELRLYERSVNRFQYHVSDKELRNALQHIPVEVTGTESDQIEVSSFRDLPRIETNKVRGGALRVVNDGIIGRSAKVWAIIEKLNIKGWTWLKNINTLSEYKSAGFMDDIIAGRPVFSFPSARGGFRLRYGRARNTGLAAIGINPLTMLVLQNFIATGTQLRLELPGKGGIVVPVDSIEPPIVKLKNSSVVRVSNQNVKIIKGKINKILFVGDILINFGDFLNYNKSLLPSGYVEEWWVMDLQKSIRELFNGDLKEAASASGISLKRLQSLSANPFYIKPNIKEAVALSSQLLIPLHPAFTFFWSYLSSVKELKYLREWLFASNIMCDDGDVSKILGKNEPKIKKILETICLPHQILDDKIIIENDEAPAFAFCLGYFSDKKFPSSKTILETIRGLSGISVKEKASTLVGARMGRPEKAKRREMKPLVHVLFPVGFSNNPRRDIIKLCKQETAFIEVVNRKCPLCKKISFGITCNVCGSKTVLDKVCPKCGKSLIKTICPTCKKPAVFYQKHKINFRSLLKNACSSLSLSFPKLLKGVKGLTNQTKTPEAIEKGILRAKYDLSVYKDGTIRFDVTNAPLTHFKISEINVSIKKLKKLGYTHDIHGKRLTKPGQLCELKTQDIILPKNGAKYFVRVAKFIDDLLTKLYSLTPYYNINDINGLIGKLIVGLAPHTSVGILGRIIGFANLNVCYAHPIWHSAKRRDCDGDEDALILALDVLLNFSLSYLPARIGGIMDAPLLLIPIVNTPEVQRQAHDIDVTDVYPQEFYEKTWENISAKDISHRMDLIKNRLGTKAQFEGFKFTTPVSDITLGNNRSKYTQFKTMIKKLQNQLELAEKIEAVDEKKVALKVLTTHFIRDIAGNLRAFSTQSFRCKKCNKRFRRLPLSGCCSTCGKSITLTVYRGGIEKYIEAAQNIIEKYDLPQYYAQRLFLIKEEIYSLFENTKKRQIKLLNFV